MRDPAHADFRCRHGIAGYRSALAGDLSIRLASVIPAKAGIQRTLQGIARWIPACAGMTVACMPTATDILSSRGIPHVLWGGLQPAPQIPLYEGPGAALEIG